MLGLSGFFMRVGKGRYKGELTLGLGSACLILWAVWSHYKVLQGKQQTQNRQLSW